MWKMWLTKTESCPVLQGLICRIFCLAPLQRTQIILDPSSNPDVIRLIQEYGRDVLDQILYQTRTYAFAIHRERKILLGQWFGSGYSAPDREQPVALNNMTYDYVCEGNDPALLPPSTGLLPDEPVPTTTLQGKSATNFSLAVAGRGQQHIIESAPPPIPPEWPPTASTQPGCPNTIPVQPSSPPMRYMSDTVVQFDQNTVKKDNWNTVVNNVCS